MFRVSLELRLFLNKHVRLFLFDPDHIDPEVNAQELDQ